MATADSHAALAAGSASGAPGAAEAGEQHSGGGRRYAYWLVMFPFLFSLIMHVAGLLGMALTAVPVEEAAGPAIAITSSMSNDAPLEELTPVELDTPEQEVEFEQPTVNAPAVEAAAVSLGDLAASDAVAEVGDIAAADGTMATLGDLAGVDLSRPSRTRGGGSPDAAGMTATFFGKPAQGSRFVFVVDNSLTMGGGKIQTVANELMKSVNALNEKQSFYIFFFSDTDYGLFHPQTAPGMVPATPENKQRLAAWLGTVELCLATNYKSAYAKAIQFQPDVINLLSDGREMEADEKKLLTAPQPSIRVNTFCFRSNQRAKQDTEGEENLRLIAQANRGEYTVVDVSREAGEAEKKNPVKRNNIRGPVWGRTLRLTPPPPKSPPQPGMQPNSPQPQLQPQQQKKPKPQQK